MLVFLSLGLEYLLRCLGHLCIFQKISNRFSTTFGQSNSASLEGFDETLFNDMDIEQTCGQAHLGDISISSIKLSF